MTQRKLLGLRAWEEDDVLRVEGSQDEDLSFATLTARTVFKVTRDRHIAARGIGVAMEVSGSGSGRSRRRRIRRRRRRTSTKQ